MGYFFSFLAGSFVGMVITCCVVAVKDKDDMGDEIDILL